jgi:glucosamine--fructose-6-phosphate aminotransferase (isomerizing)
MCGIVGYVGQSRAANILLDGLKRLEYRGYDSAGLAVWEDQQIRLTRTTGRVAQLGQLASEKEISGSTGICHTRWATHGGVTESNAHPHLSSDGKIAVVHNGVVENYLSIRNFLLEKGYTFASETDTEVLANLIDYHYRKESEYDNHGKSRLSESVRRSLLHVEGTYGLAVLCEENPEELVGARKGSPLIVGVGKGENLLASDVAALATRTSNVVYIKDGEVVRLTRENFTITTIDEIAVSPTIDIVDWDTSASELGDYRHFMEKEIFEQPAALENAMRGRFNPDEGTAKLGGLNMTAQELRQVDRILFCACGTAWHACLIAEYLIERYARIPVEVEYASEFRYRNAPLDKNTLVFVVSQSGETADTLAALRESKRKGYRTLAITNGVGSTIAREADGGVYQHAGPEIGVASTKAFTSQLLITGMIALYLGRLRDMSYADGLQMIEALRKVPEQVSESLELDSQLSGIAGRYAHYSHFFFLGRQSMFPIALEGALKLKEISYIHAEGYPAAEMKHGPLALVSPEMPSLFLASEGDILKKTLSNIQEVKARHGPVIIVASRGCSIPDGLADETVIVPQGHEAVQPIIASIPVQLLSYHMARIRGCDVDKPRNLAKSVTVE